MASICCSPPERVPATCLRPLLQAGELLDRPSPDPASMSPPRLGDRRPSPDSPPRSSAGRPAVPRAPGPGPWPRPCGPGRGSRCSPMKLDVAGLGLWSRPEMVFRVVDLPAPLAPIRVTISPSFTSKGDALDGVDAAVVDVDVVDFQHGSMLTPPSVCPGRPR